MNLPLAITGTPFIPGWNDPGQALRPFVGELVLIGTLIATLLTPFFTPRRSNVPCAMVALAGTVLALVSLFAFRVADVPGYQFRGMLVSDDVAVFWKALLYLFTAGVVLMWFSTTARDMHEGDGPEFFTLLVGATLGMSFMASTANLLMLFMAVEMASLPSYVLAGFRKTDRIGAEASLKYVLFGAATSSIMAFGLSYLYGLYGTLQIPELAQIMAHGGGGGGNAAILTIAFVGLIAGIGFKLSAVPFHFWCPDVFEGAGVDVAAFLSVASKGAGIILLLRVLMIVSDAFGFAHVHLTTTVAVLIGILGAVTATVGNTAAFVQDNLKRLLAYSSIGHAGYMICALSLLVKGAAADAAYGPATAAAQSILLYLTVYLFMNLGAFTVVGLVARHDGSETLDGYKGLGRRSPVLAVCMAVFMFSLIGLPPLAGFSAKLNIMWALAQNGSWWWALVAVIGLNTVFSLYYYARVIKVMFLEGSDRPIFFPHPLGLGIVLGCAVLLFAMFVLFSPVTRVTTDYSRLYGVADPTAGPRRVPMTVPAAPATRPVAAVSAVTP